MKNLITILVLTLTASTTIGQDITVERRELGSGTPGQVGQESASIWGNDIYHAPQYMPGNPTAATLYPRVLEVPCTQVGEVLECKGYSWDVGRSEYLLIRPVIVKEPTVVEKVVTVIVPGPEVFVEVPVKRKKE